MSFTLSEAWAEAYNKPHDDPHSVFATLMGVDRQEAKEMCWKYIWSKEAKEIWTIGQYHQASQEALFIYRFFRDMLRDVGVTAPSVKEILDKME